MGQGPLRIGFPPGADAPAHATVRAPRRSRRAPRPLCRLGDAGAVHVHRRRAPRGAHLGRRLRRLAHGPAPLTGDGARATTSRPASRTTSTGSEDGQAQYTLLTNERGGIVDDLIAYRRGADDYLLVVNASNVEPDHAALAETRDVSDDWALLAVQGPEALGSARDRDRARSRSAKDDVLGVHCLVAGTGYTGERGCELGCAPDDAVALWDAILERGRRALRARRARHAAARGLLPAARERHHSRADADRGRPRLGLRARQGVHRRRAAPPPEGGGNRGEARRVRHGRQGHPAAGHVHRGGRRGHVRLALADARPGHRPRVRRRRPRRARDEVDRRSARATARLLIS